MKYFRFPLAFLLAVALMSISVALPLVSAEPEGQSTALERGYRTGYSDGYNAGFRDTSDQAPRDFQNKDEYQRADRSYNEAWGPLEDYRDGYQQGFEVGYAAGYDKRQFDSAIPIGFRRRGATTSTNSGTGPTSDSSVDTTTGPIGSSTAGSSAGSLSIPRETVLVLELLNPLSTDSTQAGDRFQARVIEPSEYSSATVDGHVSQVRRPGKAKGVAQLQLTFDQIRLGDRAANLHAQLVEVIPMGRNEAEVDREGGVRGQDSTKDDVSKVGAATGIGAIIGAIAGGGKGAAIGAIIGGGVGTAGVMSQRGKDIRLEQGQHLKIRTSTDTNVL